MRKSAENNNIFACVVKGTLWGIACGAVSLLISAAVGLSLPDPEKYSAPLALAALFISAFVGAFISAKKCGDNGLRSEDKTAHVRDMRSGDTCHFGFCGNFRRKSQAQKTQKILIYIQKPPLKGAVFALSVCEKKSLSNLVILHSARRSELTVIFYVYIVQYYLRFVNSFC